MPSLPFRKLNVDSSCQKTRKIRYYIFEVLPSFIVSLYFGQNISSRIVDMSFSLFYQNLSYEESEMDKKYRIDCYVFDMKMLLESFLTPEHLFITRASCLLC